jgi:pimeloyl-ACP methyl ester carboxylesterase
MRNTIAAIVLLSACAAAGSLPAIPDTILIRDWVMCGPFPAAPREGITGAVEDPASFRPVAGESLRSALVQGGFAKNRKVSVDSLGWLETNYQDVRWDSIQDYYGNVGIICAGFAYAEFESPRACCALAVATSLGGFYLNGQSYLGDVYGAGWFRTPVVLDSGTNRVLLRISGYGDDRFRFMLVPSPSPLIVVKEDVTAPDLVADSALKAWIGIPVLNTTSECIRNVEIRLSYDSARVLADTVVGSVPALGAVKVPMRISIPAQAYDTLGLPVVVTLIASGSTSTDTIRLRIRKPEEVRRLTFRSGIDGSCQYYAVVYPKDFNPSRRYPVIFSLHGAGVEAAGQVGAYKPKDWAFVVAPTNRRQYGFDWQDWGRLDAMEILDTVLARLPIDPDRVLLVGHSMGGHGDWHVGLSHPDRFAVVAPEAGWPTHQIYVPWFLQRSAIFAQPEQLAIRDRALRSDNVPAMLGNALNLPLFILHGGDDDNAPTLHGRNFAAWLEEESLNFVYREVPGRNHWWNDDSLGITVCDDTALMNYIRDKKRVAGPRHVRFRTADLGTSHRAYWTDIERVRVVGRDAEIEAWASESVIRVSTTNIEQFSLELTGQPFFKGRVTVEIDGRLAGRSSVVPARLTFRLTDKGWASGQSRQEALHKFPEQYGPAKQAMMKPFVLVYGTRDSAQTAYLRHAATQEALRWWLIGNGLAPVLPDTEVTDTTVKNLDLVLFGGPKENSLTRRIQDGLPIRVKDGRLSLGSTVLGDGLAAMFVYPNPLNHDRLVLVRMGTDPAATRLSPFFGLIFSGAGVPDFMVFDKRVRRYGWTGVRAAGFFGPDWNLDPKSMVIEE